MIDVKALQKELVFPIGSFMTTIHNPYDPRKDHDKWEIWDYDNGYSTPNYIARLMNTFIDVPEDIMYRLRDKAFQEIIDHDHIGEYFVVVPEKEYEFPLIKPKS